MSSTSSLPNEASACAQRWKSVSASSSSTSRSAQAIIPSAVAPVPSAPSRAFIITAILSLIFRFENAAAAFRSPSGKKPVMFSLKRSCRAAAPIAATSTASTVQSSARRRSKKS